MRITAPRTQDERLAPLLDTPPKWLPGIDVGIQINFHLKFFISFQLENCIDLILILSFPFKGVGFSSLEFLGLILSSFFVCVQWGSDAGVVWFFSYTTHSNLVDIVTGLVVYVLYPLSPVYHTTRVRTEPPASEYF